MLQLKIRLKSLQTATQLLDSMPIILVSARSRILTRLHFIEYTNNSLSRDDYTIGLTMNISCLGYWLYHCHIDQHTNLGMALVFKVGQLQDLPPVPQRFPTCGDF